MDETADIKDKERALNDAVINVKRSSLEYRSRTATDLNELQNIFKEQSKLTSLHISLV